jgi:hypothetical protein
MNGKRHYMGMPATSSEISKEKIFYNRIFEDQSRRANSVFYARNLETNDIEGSKPGSLASKAVKNKNIAEQIREFAPNAGQLPPIG